MGLEMDGIFNKLMKTSNFISKAINKKSYLKDRIQRVFVNKPKSE